MLNKAKNETKELLRKIFFKQITSGNIKSNVKVLEFHGNKWVTALPQFPCFRKLLDYNLNEKVLVKPQFTEKEKATLSIVSGFFSNAAWFVISITWKKTTTELSMYNINLFINSG